VTLGDDDGFHPREEQLVDRVVPGPADHEVRGVHDVGERIEEGKKPDAGRQGMPPDRLHHLSSQVGVDDENHLVTPVQAEARKRFQETDAQPGNVPVTRQSEEDDGLPGETEARADGAPLRQLIRAHVRNPAEAGYLGHSLGGKSAVPAILIHRRLVIEAVEPIVVLQDGLGGPRAGDGEDLAMRARDPPGERHLDAGASSIPTGVALKHRHHLVQKPAHVMLDHEHVRPKPAI